MSNIRVGNNALTNTIYAGTVTKKQMWGKNKTDVTIDCLMAVIDHGLTFGQPIILSNQEGEPEFKIEVTDLRPKVENNTDD